MIFIDDVLHIKKKKERKTEEYKRGQSLLMGIAITRRYLFGKNDNSQNKKQTKALYQNVNRGEMICLIFKQIVRRCITNNI